MPTDILARIEAADRRIDEAAGESFAALQAAHDAHPLGTLEDPREMSFRERLARRVTSDPGPDARLIDKERWILGGSLGVWSPGVTATSRAVIIETLYGAKREREAAA